MCNEPLIFFKNVKAKHLSFPVNGSKQLLQYLDINLKLYTSETVLIHAGINVVLNDKTQSNTKNLNIKYMVDKCEKYIYIWCEKKKKYIYILYIYNIYIYI